MQFAFRPLTEADALAIARWHYDEPYTFYDADQDADDLAELLDPASWVEVYHAVDDERGELVGYHSFEQEGDTVVVGLGLRPDLTGRGLGASFVQAGLDFARARYTPRRFRLRVATFNRRAIAVYERAGFSPVRTFMQRTNGGEFEFLEMERDE
jgi:ribosomal-protein-alanine N-acetyltransferase